MTRRRAALGALAAALVLGLLVAGHWAPLLAVDAAVTRRAARVSHGPVLLAARAVTLLGAPAVVWVLALLGAVWLAGRRRAAAVYVLVVRVAAQVLSTGVKDLVGRPRPRFVHAVAQASGPSFPSGHALGAAALWVSLAVLAPRRPVVALAATFALLVAASRVLLGVHWLSDVVAGLLLGTGVALGCARLVR